MRDRCRIDPLELKRQPVEAGSFLVPMLLRLVFVKFAKVSMRFGIAPDLPPSCPVEGLLRLRICVSALDA